MLKKKQYKKNSNVLLMNCDSENSMILYSIIIEIFELVRLLSMFNKAEDKKMIIYYKVQGKNFKI